MCETQLLNYMVHLYTMLLENSMRYKISLKKDIGNFSIRLSVKRSVVGV